MARKKATNEEQQGEPVMENVEEKLVAKPEKKLNSIQKIRIAGHLADATEDDTVKNAILKLPKGEYIFEIFENAINNEVEKLINGDSASLDEISEASEKVEYIVNSCMKLQEQLITLVKGKRAIQQVTLDPVQHAATNGQRAIGRKQVIFDSTNHQPEEDENFIL